MYVCAFRESSQVTVFSMEPPESLAEPLRIFCNSSSAARRIPVWLPHFHIYISREQRSSVPCPRINFWARSVRNFRDTCNNNWEPTRLWQQHRQTWSCNLPWQVDVHGQSNRYYSNSWTALQYRRQIDNRLLHNDKKLLINFDIIDIQNFSAVNNIIPLGLRPHPCISSGSDQSRSHMAPSCGTSCFRSIVRIWSRVFIDGDNPPWTQNTRSSIKALNDK